MQKQQALRSVPLTKQDEKILVVPRNQFFVDGAWQGFKAVNPEQYLEIITSKKQFLWRSLMEQDERYKQIIPYLIFEYNSRYFLMQRKANASETRLQNKYSLGIGGHIREQDITSADLFAWAQREFEEEVSYDGTMTITPLGILNDDSNAVGRVHVGLVLLLKGNSNAISVKSELKSGKLVSLEECTQLYPSMESWSKMIVDHLKTL